MNSELEALHRLQQAVEALIRQWEWEGIEQPLPVYLMQDLIRANDRVREELDSRL